MPLNTTTAAAREVIAIDMGVPDWSTLIAHLDPAIGVILLPSGGDGLAALALALADYGTLDALHLVSHGAAGQLHLGALRLDAANLAAQGDALAAIASHLAPASDLLLYGCAVAEGAAGAAFVEALSAALGGVDVAASVNATGAQALGGDWALEYAHGHVETALPFAPFDIVAYNAAIFADDLIAPSSLALATASDSGSSHSDGITNVTKPVLTGNADIGTTVTLYDSDGITALGSVVAVNGTWSIKSTVALSDGEHTLTAKSSDGGATSPVSEILTVTIDTAVSVMTTPVLRPGFDSGASSTDNITNASTVSISGSTEAISTINVYDNGGSTSLYTVLASSGSYGASGLALSEGTHTLTVVATDQAGNVRTSGGLLVTIDRTAPTVAITSSTASLKIGDTATITFTFSEDPGATFAWNGSAGDVVVTGGALGAITGTGLTRTATFTPTAAVNGGTASITIAAGLYDDTAGNHGGAGTTPSLTFDTVAPAAPSAPVLAAASDHGSSNSDALTNLATPTFTGSAEPGATVRLYDNDGTPLGSVNSGSGSWSITTSSLNAGVHTVTVTQTDAAGNVSVPSGGTSVTIDTTAPTVAITSNVASLKVGDTATITFTFSEDPGATFTWNGSAGDVVVTGGALGAISGTGLTRTATFTPTAAVNGDAASITIAAGLYDDTAGNHGGAGTTPSLTFDTVAPAAPSAPVLATASDHGSSNSDAVTNLATPTFTGSAEPGATVRLYDNDGTPLGSVNSGSGSWSITTSSLSAGVHTVTVTQTDAAGNVSVPSGGTSVTIDTTAPAVAITSNVASLKVGDTATITFTFSEDPGATFTWNGSAGDVVVTGGTLGAITGTGLTRTATFTPSASTNNGVASITVVASSYDDLAGNHGGAGTTPSLNFDTLAPVAPAAPTLASASDTGVVGDGVTEATTPVFTGVAEANARVTLYEGSTVLGTATANGSGSWSITSSALAIGAHSLSAKQVDVAGNLSAAGAALALTIAAPVVVVVTPPAPPPPPPLVDGVTVVNAPVALPGGGLGVQVTVPIVVPDRVDSTGNGVADIPLVTAAGATTLLAQVASGFGLTAIGGTSAPAASSLDYVLKSIVAASPASTPAEQAHLAADAQAFLKLLPAGAPLLVETIKPTSAATAPNGALTLTGTSNANQHTALVIDAGGLAAGSKIVLNGVDFAAVAGAASVTGTTSGQILSGDAASQQFSVAADLGSSVFAGGGNDTLQLTPAAPVLAPLVATAALVPTGATVLHGGTGVDTAVFSGARADYTLDLHQGYIVIAPVGAPQQKTLLVNVESLKFADTTAAVDNHAALATLAGLYQTVLGRQADAAGFDFWGGADNRGVSLGHIAVTMMSSSEALATHDNFNGSTLHDLTLLYQNLFGRAVDSEGLAFWGGAMARGVTLEQVADGVVHSVEFATHAITVQGWNFTL